MEKISISNKREVMLSIESEYQKAMLDNDFLRVLKGLKVDESTLKNNVSLIYDTVEELKHCSKCKGLFECKLKKEGHVDFPAIINDRLNFVFKPCKYQKKANLAKEQKLTSENVLLTARMKDIDVTDKSRVKVIKWIKNFYDNYDLHKTQKGLYLHGSFGAGKTFLISALFNELRHKKNVQSHIVYFPDLLRDLRDDFNTLESKLDNIKSIPLLLIDDIGAENTSPWSRDEVLGSIMQYRMNMGLATFLTSNLNIEELETHLSVTKLSDDSLKSRRIIERIKHITDDIELISVNKRT